MTWPGHQRNRWRSGSRNELGRRDYKVAFCRPMVSVVAAHDPAAAGTTHLGAAEVHGRACISANEFGPPIRAELDGALSALVDSLQTGRHCPAGHRFRPTA